MAGGPFSVPMLAHLAISGAMGSNLPEESHLQVGRRCRERCVVVTQAATVHPWVNTRGTDQGIVPVTALP